MDRRELCFCFLNFASYLLDLFSRLSSSFDLREGLPVFEGGECHMEGFERIARPLKVLNEPRGKG
jgi:hypothetical protein